MSQTTPTETQLQDLLSAVTDALLADEGELDTIITRYDVPRGEVDSLVKIVRHLHRTLVGREPSDRFVQRLKTDLMGTPGWGVVARVRHLPPRVHIAAAVALVAGFMLFTRRRLVEDAQLEDKHEIPALQ